MEKHIIEENGIGYTLGEDGLYYPDLKLPEGTHYEIGRYGLMQWENLKNYRRGGCDKKTDICVVKVRIVMSRIFYTKKNKCSDLHIENEILL